MSVNGRGLTDRTKRELSSLTKKIHEVNNFNGALSIDV